MVFVVKDAVFNEIKNGWEVDVVRGEDGKLMDSIVLEEKFLPPQYNGKGKLLWKLPPISQCPKLTAKTVPLVLDEYRRRKKERKKKNQPSTTEPPPHNQTSSTQPQVETPTTPSESTKSNPIETVQQAAKSSQGDVLKEPRRISTTKSLEQPVLKEQPRSITSFPKPTKRTVDSHSNLNDFISRIKALEIENRDLKVDKQKLLGMNRKFRAEKEALTAQVGQLERKVCDLSLKLSLAPPPGFTPALPPSEFAPPVSFSGHNTPRSSPLMMPPGFTARPKPKIVYTIQELKFLDPKYQVYLQSKYGTRAKECLKK